MVARPELSLDAVDDVCPAEEHLLAVHGTADDVRTGPQVTRPNRLAGGQQAEGDLRFASDGGPVKTTRLPRHGDM